MAITAAFQAEDRGSTPRTRSTFINSRMEKELTIGDYLVISPFAWVMSQSIIHMDVFWLFVAWWMFNLYAYKRRSWADV
jgi:hypothetical protein